ncbi:four helix bundle protein [Chloroflexales bacterium ZM16-3]|nr:four helix bundle protein [Chloroflexales bacterium ZM16-3]
MKSFRDLRVWQVGMELVTQVYALTRSFPADERFGLTNQLRRAAVSIPSNIAEGHTREYTREYLYHLSVAQGSLAEIQTQIEVAARLEYFAETERIKLISQATALAKQLYTLRNSLQRKESYKGAPDDHIDPE